MSSRSPQEILLQEAIPHRVRAMLASTKRLMAEQNSTEPIWPDKVVMRCWTDSVWEGRLAALRWLCEFVGVKHTKNFPGRPNPSAPGHNDITFLPGGIRFDLGLPEANFLADAWLACTQGCVHPTLGSGHPSIGDAERERAFKIITDHLSATVYKSEPDWMKKWVLVAKTES